MNKKQQIFLALFQGLALVSADNCTSSLVYSCDGAVYHYYTLCESGAHENGYCCNNNYAATG